MQDLAREELIGLRVRVAASSDPGLRGVAGTVVDETRGTFTVQVQGSQGPREVIVPKAGQDFEFTPTAGSAQRLEGAALARRPEDRTRMARPRNQQRRAAQPR